MSDETGNKVWIHLYGGEQDGFRIPIELRTAVPKRFYAWHVGDEKKFESIKGPERNTVKNRLATMAYELFDDVHIDDKGTRELRYQRCESADKAAVPDPAV